ncbi:MAG: transcriptional activator NhaR [Methylohalobius sp.]|nr:transcriptional activator NhaR [Methylohalobius sp.]
MSKRRLNYQHLFYFWQVVREQSVSAAASKLHLAQPTISSQLAMLEEALGERLLHKEGRRLVPTETGRLVFQYAEEIFSLGQELINTLKGRPSGRAMRLTVGVSDALPKLVAYRLLEPAFHLDEPVQIICYEGPIERLMAEMVWREIDLILTDAPLTPASSSKAFSYFLGESAVCVFAAPALVDRYRAGFPASLNGAPFLLPTSNTALRRSLEQWFHAQGILPRVQAEIEDSALLKTFGSSGIGLFIAPALVAEEIMAQYGVSIVGQIEAVREQFYAIAQQRKQAHLVVNAILDRAQDRLYSPTESGSI